ncbi:PREDICTED: uncharacterized protein LOC109589795 [Amphimedon queenslandica]|nr:PREDICTED: uncharacterized protein LOC109589795 [Amphimedon queenslandica]|eukprot:XP_019861368.1 PREDICTED: uncharacterized protein LOC109589795 [Amphimedon queenslandica]
MSVLLIGSTGMGKSTFGNYLLDPDDKHMVDNPTFATATGDKPMTQEFKVARKKVQIEGGRNVWLGVIDTPGLNESATKDLSHMIDIIKNLNECQEIRAFILVVKFNAKIDAQYRATMEYYSKLLPGPFKNNVLIVMTDYATDERSVKQRERQRIDVEKVKHNTILELGQCSNNQITYLSQLFMIDCQPLSSYEIETSLAVRTAILSYIFLFPPIKVSNLMVRKADYIKKKDDEKYWELMGEIEGYNKRLITVRTNSKDLLTDTHIKEIKIIEKESEIKNLETKLRNKNTTEDVEAEHWSVNEEMRMMQSMTQYFSIKSPHEITKYRTWTNGGCEFKTVVQTSHTVSGRVEGKFMRGLYASITLYTEKKIKYADEIEEIKRRIAREKASLTQCKVELEDYKKLYKELLNEMELLQQYINERRTNVSKAISDFMTVKEAVLRLKELERNY